MPLTVTHGVPTLFIRRPAYERASLTRARLDERLGLTDAEFQVDGDHCHHCDAVTLRVVSPIWNRLLPMFRTSWCYECNWHGLLRRGPLTPASRIEEFTKLP